MNFPIFVAKRYLFAKKTHNVINIISYISVIGVAVGTFALIVILSVANGYDSLTRSLYSAFDPDIKISTIEGKTFVPNKEDLQKIAEIDGVLGFSQVLEENTLVSYKNQNGFHSSATQTIATMKGVDSEFEKLAGIIKTQEGRYGETSYIVLGDFDLWYNDMPQVVMGFGIAQTLGVNLSYNTPLQVWVPKRGTKVSLSNPMDAMWVDYVYPAGIFAIEQNFDNNYFFVPIEFAHNLLNYKNGEISAIEVKIESDVKLKKIQKEIQSIVGSSFSVKNRHQQNETLYRMLSAEKYAIYIILTFIITLFSFNIIGSISMLIVDKKKDIVTLKILGCDAKTIKQIFFYEGCMIAIGGAIIGLILGLALCLAQQYFKIIKLPDSFIVDAYPVKILFGDILMILAFVLVVGYTMARLPAWYLSKKMDL